MTYGQKSRAIHRVLKRTCFLAQIQKGITDEKFKLIPIADPAASLPLYANYLQVNQGRVAPLLQKLTAIISQAIFS
ncbi:hypothetical protein [Limosilactobacillus difficilis]|uniref:hypothetical protein n=1 Tax=Limosilactobacillus difficilis TaxID=2991838 RepID=UPI0024BB4DAB|nr:hypothetical protein [Limosilactobacillus difficilis]